MRRTAPSLALVLVLALGACAPGGDAAGTGGRSDLTVFAASSLTGAFTRIGTNFEAAHPGATVTFDFGPSDGLAAQIDSEGTADVFAAASATWMDDVQRRVGVSDRTDFARNQLVIVTPPDDPAHVASIQDLAAPGVQLVLAAEGVPVGDYAREALTNAGIAADAEANVVSNEEDDASLVAKITSGEADAAIVYASDVTSAIAPLLHTVAIAPSVNVVAAYPIAVVAGSTQAGLARAFVAYVTGSEGQATLKTFGFLPGKAT